MQERSWLEQSPALLRWQIAVILLGHTGLTDEFIDRQIQIHLYIHMYMYIDIDRQLDREVDRSIHR